MVAHTYNPGFVGRTLRQEDVEPDTNVKQEKGRGGWREERREERGEEVEEKEEEEGRGEGENFYLYQNQISCTKEVK